MIDQKTFDEEIAPAMVAFCKRVLKGEGSGEETAVLPQMVSLTAKTCFGKFLEVDN